MKNAIDKQRAKATREGDKVRRNKTEREREVEREGEVYVV